MRIGLIADAYKPYISGVTTSLNMLAEGLIKEGHEVFIITTTGKGAKEYDKNYPYIIRFRGFPVPKRSLRMFRFMKITKRHVKTVMDLNLDVMHVHSEFSLGNLAVRIKKEYDVPMVYTVHTMYQEYLHFVSKLLARFFKQKLMSGVKRLMNRFIRRAEVTIVPSKKIEDLMRSYQIKGNYQIVPTGIELTKFKKSTYTKKQITELKEKTGLKEHDYVCLFVGRISIEKDIEVLFDGFKAANNPKLKMVVVGDGPHFKKLKDYVKKIKIADNVIFTGPVPWDDIGLYYQLGDCFLNASKSETQGLTYIEALAAELPVIVKYDEVLEAVVEEGYNGLFFHENHELPELINKISNDKELAKSLSQNAAKSVEKYSQETYTKNALKMYEEAIKINKLKKEVDKLPQNT